MSSVLAIGHLQHLPGVLRELEPTLNAYGYLAVAGLVFIEDAGVPLPGETALILGGVYAGTGRLNIALVALIAFVGAVAGDNLGFAVGHFGGRRVIDRFGRYVFLTPERVERAQRFFTRHGGKIIIVARFVEGLRQANGIVAGVSGIAWSRFVIFNAVGAALWVATWASVGYWSGGHIGDLLSNGSRYSAYAAGAASAAVLVVLFVRVLKRHSDSHQQPQLTTTPNLTDQRSAP